MKFVDVTTLTQEAVAQTLGTTYLTKDGKLASIESYKLVDVGKDVLDSGSVDAYVKSLLTQMGKMVVDAKRYAGRIAVHVCRQLRVGRLRGTGLFCSAGFNY